MADAAYVLRLSPSGIDRMAMALHDGDIVIGWAAPELIDSTLDRSAFREVVRCHFYTEDESYRRAGAAAGHMWRFLREMKVGDLVVVPYGANFYVAEVRQEPRFLPDKVEEDTAFRRSVIWLNDGQPIPRSFAKSALSLRMKVQGTSADATDVLDEILEALEAAKSGDHPTFARDLHSKLIAAALHEIRHGRMEDYGFERLVALVLDRLGAHSTEIVSRRKDIGVDVVATFRLAGVFPQPIAVQVKHYQPDPPIGREVVDKLVHGMTNGEDDFTYGLVVTSGAFGPCAFEAVAEYESERKLTIKLVDGEDFAKLVVETGVSVSKAAQAGEST